jgi:outer membrane lipoprotein SlyB
VKPSTPQDIAILPSNATIPRAVWIGFGALGLVTAALAGALVMRSVAPSTPPDPAASSLGAPMAEVPPAETAATATTATTPIRKSPPRHETSNGTSGTGSASAQAPWHAPGGTTRAVACASCGVVESVTAVQQKGQGSGIGVVAGGVAGGLLGNQIGGGNGKTAMTVLGAIGGGFAGNEVEKRVRTETVYDVTVRMDDGSARSFRRAQAMAVGSAVTVDGDTLRLSSDSTQRDGSNTMRTSSPAGRSI